MYQGKFNVYCQGPNVILSIQLPGKTSAIGIPLPPPQAFQLVTMMMACLADAAANIAFDNAMNAVDADNQVKIARRRQDIAKAAQEVVKNIPVPKIENAEELEPSQDEEE